MTLSPSGKALFNVSLGFLDTREIYLEKRSYNPSTQSSVLISLHLWQDLLIFGCGSPNSSIESHRPRIEKVLDPYSNLARGPFFLKLILSLLSCFSRSSNEVQSTACSTKFRLLAQFVNRFKLFGNWKVYFKRMGLDSVCREPILYKNPCDNKFEYLP